MIGKPLADKYVNNEEALAYFMNGKMDWSKISLEGKKEILNLLNSSNIFNLKSNFWKNRLPNK